MQTRPLSRLSSRELPGPREAAGADSDDEDAEWWHRAQKAHSSSQLAASGRLSMISQAGAASRRQSNLSAASIGAKPAPGAGKATDPDSEDEQWAHAKLAAVSSRTTSLFRPAAAASALLQRRLSAVSTASHAAATPAARAKAAGESDSDDEAWATARVARRASAAASAAALPVSRAASLKLQAPLFRRPSAAAASAAPDQAADRSEDSDEERWQRLKRRAQADSPAQGTSTLRV